MLSGEGRYMEDIMNVLPDTGRLPSLTSDVDPSKVHQRVGHGLAEDIPYVSPYVALDPRFKTAVLQIRDSDTGDVRDQFPSHAVLEARDRAAKRAETAERMGLGAPDRRDGNQAVSYDVLQRAVKGDLPRGHATGQVFSTEA